MTRVQWRVWVMFLCQWPCMCDVLWWSLGWGDRISKREVKVKITLTKMYQASYKQRQGEIKGWVKMNRVWQREKEALSFLDVFLWCKGPCSSDSQVTAGIIKSGFEVATFLSSVAIWGEKEQTIHVKFNFIYVIYSGLWRVCSSRKKLNFRRCCVMSVFCAGIFGSNNTNTTVLV